MRAVWAKIRKFIFNPIAICAAASVVLLLLGLWFWIAGVSYEYPGPAEAVMMLAMAVFLVGVGLSSLLPQNRGEAQNVLGRLPRLIGLELLAQRWQEFQPAERDRQILDEQIQIMLSIVQRHLYTCDEIRLVNYFRGTKIKGGAFLATASPNITPLVLKFDSLANITKEKRNYGHCVREFLRDTPGEAWEPDQQHGSIEHEDWGAIAYNFVGQSAGLAALKQLQTFGAYYLNHNEAQIAAVTKKIFMAIEPWWMMRRGWPVDCRRGGPRNLYDEYNRLTRKHKEMKEGIQKAGQTLKIKGLERIKVEQDYIDLGLDTQLRNPFNWIRDVFQAGRLAAWSVEHRQDSIVHGDFHAGNILIEDGGRPRVWLIDFPHVHVGPTIQDIARLEADIRFGLVSNDTLQAIGLQGMYDCETSLPPIYHFEAGSYLEMPADKRLQKMWQTVQLLRGEVKRHMIGADDRPYCLALLHATLPVLYYRDRSPWQKLYAFVSAALLCERLDD